jgi:hypothetical protein
LAALCSSFPQIPSCMEHHHHHLPLTSVYPCSLSGFHTQQHLLAHLFIHPLLFPFSPNAA